MTNPNQASPSELMLQAPLTVDVYLRAALLSIDDLLGKGYAAKHPELIAAYIAACTADYAATLASQRNA